MGAKLRRYTQLGSRIHELCGTQDQIAVALGLDRAQVSRKLRGVIALTVEELVSISIHFKFPVWLFFIQPDMDGKQLAACYKMFRYDPIALDWVIEAFITEHKNLKKLGEIAKQMCKEKKDAVPSS